MEVFVMMPFDPAFSDVRAAIRSAGGNVKSVLVSFVDEGSKTGKIDDHIRDSIRISDACVVDITGRNPNVIWEMGFAQAIGKTIVVISQEIKHLFFDTQNVKTILYNHNNLRSLTQELTSVFESESFQSNFHTPAETVRMQAKNPTTPAAIASSLGGTAYDFQNLMARADNRIVLCAQNHGFIVKQGALSQNLIFDFLQKDTSNRVDIVMCGSSHDHAVKTWAYVTSEEYPEDLRESERFFEHLLANAESMGLAPQVTLTRLPLVPLSATFVDPISDRGILVMVPNTYQSVSTIRPAIVLSRRDNYSIFDYYWGIFESKISWRNRKN